MQSGKGARKSVSSNDMTRHSFRMAYLKALCVQRMRIGLQKKQTGRFPDHFPSDGVALMVRLFDRYVGR